MLETILVVAAFLAGVALKFIHERMKAEKDPLWKDILEAVGIAIETAPPELAGPIKRKVAEVAEKSGVGPELYAFVKGVVEKKVKE